MAICCELCKRVTSVGSKKCNISGKRVCKKCRNHNCITCKENHASICLHECLYCSGMHCQNCISFKCDKHGIICCNNKCEKKIIQCGVCNRVICLQCSDNRCLRCRKRLCDDCSQILHDKTFCNTCKEIRGRDRTLNYSSNTISISDSISISSKDDSFSSETSDKNITDIRFSNENLSLLCEIYAPFRIDSS